MNFFSSAFSSNIQSLSCISSGSQLHQQHHHDTLEEHDYGIHHLYICINRGNNIRHTGIAFQSIAQDVKYQFVSNDMEIKKNCDVDGSASADPESKPTSTHLIYDTYGTSAGFRMYDKDGSDKEYEFILIGTIDLTSSVIHLLNTLDHLWYHFILNNCRIYVLRTIRTLYHHHHINKHMKQQMTKIVWNEIKQDCSYGIRIIRELYQSYRTIQNRNIPWNGSMFIASEMVEIMKAIDDKMNM